MVEFDSTAKLNEIKVIAGRMMMNTVIANGNNTSAIEYFTKGMYARDAATLADKIVDLDIYLSNKGYQPEQWADVNLRSKIEEKDPVISGIEANVGKIEVPSDCVYGHDDCDCKMWPDPSTRHVVMFEIDRRRKARQAYEER